MQLINNLYYTAGEWRARRTIGMGWGRGETPWEGTLGNPKKSHGRAPMGGEPMKTQRDPMEKITETQSKKNQIGNPNDPMGGDSWNLPLEAQQLIN